MAWRQLAPHEIEALIQEPLGSTTQPQVSKVPLQQCLSTGDSSGSKRSSSYSLETASFSQIQYGHALTDTGIVDVKHTPAAESACMVPGRELGGLGERRRRGGFNATSRVIT